MDKIKKASKVWNWTSLVSQLQTTHQCKIKHFGWTFPAQTWYNLFSKFWSWHLNTPWMPNESLTHIVDMVQMFCIVWSFYPACKWRCWVPGDSGSRLMELCDQNVSFSTSPNECASRPAFQREGRFATRFPKGWFATRFSKEFRSISMVAFS